MRPRCGAIVAPHSCEPRRKRGRGRTTRLMPTPHKDAPSEEELYAPVEWRTAAEFEDTLYETSAQIAKITINRPEVRNAFRPQTLRELRRAFDLARDDLEVASIIFTGAGTEAFCSGGDQRIRGDDGYIGDDEVAREGIG